MRLVPQRQLTSSHRELIRKVNLGLPLIDGDPISVCAQPQLTAHRGKLFSMQPGRGTPVYAAGFVPQRRIVIDSAVFTDTALLRLILVHEAFHFVWPRLGNRVRSEFRALLAHEWDRHARGELGESSLVRKELCVTNPGHWTEYVCESFCDTAAYLYSGVSSHPWFQLAARWRNRRESWFRELFKG